MLRKGAILLIRLYQSTLSRMIPGACRFHPSCSQYAIECYQSFGFFEATARASWRILRCNPFSRGYFDPVPERKH